MKKIILSIDGMTCSACSNGLEKYLNKQDGVISASVNLIMNSASIEYDDKKLNIEDLNKFVKQAGFESLGKYKLNLEEKAHHKDKVKLIIIGIITLIVFYISMSHMLGLPHIESLSPDDNPLVYGLLLMILTTIVLVLGFDIIKNGFKNFIHKTPNMDSLIMLGVLSSFIYSVYEVIMISMSIEYHSLAHSLYFESATMVIFFVKLGRLIESNNKNKTKTAIQKLVTITPKNAIVLREGKEKVVTIDEVQAGEVLVCKPGGKIAVDGEIIEGETHIDESFITGESTPVKKKASMKVLAGSINYDGYIKYKAEKIGRESTVSEIVKLVVEATSKKTPIEKTADKISGVFVPIVIAISIITLVAWLIISNDIGVAINYFVSVLVVACPCSLGLATPLAIVVASGLASSKGILVKSGDVLENSYKIKNFLFDKTGTLTNGNLQVSKIFNYSEEKDEDIIKYVASIEKKSEHPIAKAIVEYATLHKIETTECEDFKSIAGEGVYAKINADEFYIGNSKVLTNISEQNAISSLQANEDELTQNGNSILYVIKNNKVISLIGVKDIVRSTSAELISNLDKRNISSIMLTGDNEKTANVIANDLKISSIVSNCSPKEKSQKVKDYKKDGIVAMCGDGINDSISLIEADIGISISNGTDISINSANVVLMNDDLMKIIDLIDISKKTIKIIKQNLFWACIYNICMIPIACGLFKSLGLSINPIIGSAAMMISSIIVVLNSLRINSYTNCKKG